MQIAWRETVNAQFPAKLKPIFQPYRYKVLHGGRGSGKSWAVARALLILAASKPLRILCAREIQKSIKQSVHQLLTDQIQSLGLGQFYEVLETEIRGKNGSLFSFAGLAMHTVESVKSFEGMDRVWIEEAQSVSDKSWAILTPTIRKPESEIWLTLNPDLDTDPTYQRFIVNTPPDSLVIAINWKDNPWFPDVLDREREHCLKTMPDQYDNIWEGKPKSVVDGAIYAGEYQTMFDDGRITAVTHDPKLKAHAVFDLGWADSMSIIIVQRAGSECRIIDYVEESHQTLDWYSNLLRQKNYNWGTLYLPHDAVVKDYRTGHSADEIMRSMGWNTEIVPIGDVEGGIRAARMLFPRVWMDKAKTARLQECLKRYRRAINAKTDTAGKPLHDEFSHGADAFRYLATAIDGMKNDNQRTRRDNTANRASSWQSF